MDEAQAHNADGLNSTPIDARGLKAADRLAQWMATGVSQKDATKWRAAWGDEIGPYDVWQWRAAGFGPKESYAWAHIGLSVTDALEWKALGCTPKLAAVFETKLTLRRWIDRGFTPTDAKSWVIDAGISDPELASKWLAIGCGPLRAARWRAVRGVLTLDDARTWMQLGCGPGEAQRWLSVDGISSAADAKAWRNGGMTAEDAVLWSQLLEDGLAGSGTWTAIGVGPKEARKWIDLDATMFTAEVYAWKSIGVTPKALYKWRDAFRSSELIPHALSPALVHAWMFAGCSPKVAARCTAAGLSATDVLRLNETGVSAKEASRLLHYQSPVPAKATNLSSGRNRIEHTRSASCATGAHDACANKATCPCGCHCWHDEARFDAQLQSELVGTQSPKSFRKRVVSRRCQSPHARSHHRCRAAARCTCHCHCWHYFS